jgi:N-acetylglucosaminyldiphosphoundecaprenol N-acetyl-beta-D-mannosaminyltransferase
MSPTSTFECFGLVIHGLDGAQTITRINAARSRGERVWIVTANPEILLQAKRAPSYWHILRQADLRIVDGFGLQLVGWLRGARPARCTGVDLAERLLAEAATHNWKVAFLGGQHGEADTAAWNMRQRYPTLRILSEAGGNVRPDGTNDAAMEEAMHRLTLEAPDILFVALSFPGQEAWIASHRSEFPSVHTIIGVGGTLNYWAKTLPRAPRIMQRLGLEWLWRLVQEPRRLKRIWNAVVVFPLTVLLDRMRS